jgi:transketolase
MTPSRATGKLIVCYDDNHITIDGDIDLCFTEDVSARYRSYGWHVVTVEDTNDLVALRAAIAEAKAETQRPSLIKVQYSTNSSTLHTYV